MMLALRRARMSRLAISLRKSRRSTLQLIAGMAIVGLVALPLVVMATQFLAQVERLATWSPLQLVSVFAGLFAVKVIVLLCLGRMLRRNAE